MEILSFSMHVAFMSLKPILKICKWSFYMPVIKKDDPVDFEVKGHCHLFHLKKMTRAKNAPSGGALVPESLQGKLQLMLL